MAWTDARDFARAAARFDSMATLQTAVAVRMAQHADDKAWAKWVRALGVAGG